MANKLFQEKALEELKEIKAESDEDLKQTDAIWVLLELLTKLWYRKVVSEYAKVVK